MAFWRRKKQRQNKGGRPPLTRKRELEDKKIEAEIAEARRARQIDAAVHATLVRNLKQGSDSPLYRALLQSRYKFDINDIPKESVEDKIFQEELEKNPEYRKAVVQARLDALKPKGAARAKLEERIAAHAEELLAKDQSYLDRIAKQKLDHIISGASNDRMGAFLLQYKQIKEWEAEVKGKEEGEGGDNFWGQIAGAFLANLPTVLAAVMGQQMGSLPVGRGTGVETAPKEAPALPKRTGAAVEEPPLESKVAQPVTPPEERTLNIPMWLQYLEKDPVEFVDALQVQVQKEGEAGVEFAVRFLLQYDDADKLLGFLSLFESKMPANAREALGKLKEKKEWVGIVLKLVRERFGGA
jgi:hypothetical protein